MFETLFWKNLKNWSIHEIWIY